MSDLELLLAALDDTIADWVPDDAVERFAVILRRNLDRRMREGKSVPATIIWPAGDGSPEVRLDGWVTGWRQEDAVTFTDPSGRPWRFRERTSRRTDSGGREAAGELVPE